MRRHTIAIALSALVLCACSERTEPAAPRKEQPVLVASDECWGSYTAGGERNGPLACADGVPITR